MLLAGDIGGTKTVLAIFTVEAGLKSPLLEKTFPSSSYPSLEMIVSEFLSQTDLKPERATFGVAGPVVERQATITNLPWVIDERRLQAALDFPSVHLLNDLEAIAEAVPMLNSGDLETLREGDAVPGGTIGIIAPGTGLGEAFLTWDGTRYQAHASEGGHTNFGPRNALELDMLSYLLERFDNVSYERVCSGAGFPNIYAYLKDSGYAEEPDWLTKQLAEAKDPTPVITNAALDDERPCVLCRAALNMFVSILGSEAGNLVLKLMATGGLFLGGGIPPRILPVLRTEHFLKAFLSKGRMSKILHDVPVYVILNRRVGLLGAACYGLDMQNSEKGLKT